MNRRQFITAALWVTASFGMLVAGQGSTIPWDVSRAAGFVSYLLLATSSALGIATSSLLFRRLLPQAEVINLHIFTSYLLVAATVIHIVALKFDDYIGFGMAELLVPFESPYRPFAVAMGIASAYMIIILVASFSAKRRLGTPVWRWIHYLSIPAYATGLIHGVMAGSNSGSPLAIAMYLITGATIFYLVLARTLVSRKEAPAIQRREPHPSAE